MGLRRPQKLGRALKICDPLTIAGIALTAGSTVANSVAQGQVARARNDALAAERIRQNGYDRETDALNTQSQDRYQNFSEQQDQRGQELGDYFAGQQIEGANANTAAAQEQSVAPTSSNITMREEQKQRANATAFTDEQGRRLGDLRSFGDLLGGIGREQARDASQIGQIGSFKRGSSAVLPYELEAANSAGGGAKMFGDLLGLGGSFATAKGLSAEDWVGKTSSAGTTIDTIVPRPRPAPFSYNLYPTGKR
ncbi:hypothetical protein [Kaistia sp. UC242_56]|uniref:hypothetical protein n=1 Tax=Kaistia sp. UC242_56 TaxID=3374625 RepID=UPI0037B92E61